MQCDLAAMWPVAMFDQIDPLPRSQSHPTAGHRNLQIDRQMRRLDMGRHVIGTFGPMPQIGHRRVVGPRHETGQPRHQVALHIRVGVLLNQQRARRMPHEQRQQSIALRQPIRDPVRDIDQPRSRRVDPQRRLHIRHPVVLPLVPKERDGSDRVHSETEDDMTDPKTGHGTTDDPNQATRTDMPTKSDIDADVDRHPSNDDPKTGRGTTDDPNQADRT